MKVLAFDTCLGAVSAAVGRQGSDGSWQTCSRLETHEGGHAERLMPMIAEVMAEAGVSFTDLDRIAVTVGPGTFTGVRAGVAAARGLALAATLPVVATSSLAVIAHRARTTLGLHDAEPLAVAVDARRGTVYLQLFPARSQDAGEPVLVAPADAAALIGAGPVTIVGSGAAAVAGAAAAAGGRAHAELGTLEPDARTLVALAAGLAPVSALRPLYLRPPDAKPQADKALARAAPP